MSDGWISKVWLKNGAARVALATAWLVFAVTLLSGCDDTDPACPAGTEDCACFSGDVQCKGDGFFYPSSEQRGYACY